MDESELVLSCVTGISSVRVMKLLTEDVCCRMALSASRILTMLPSTPHVEAVYLDPSAGILAGLRELPDDTPSIPIDTAAQPPESPSGPSTTTMSGSSLASDTETPHTILIDQTTLDPTTAVRVANEVQTTTNGRALMLDAPVSGGKRFDSTSPS